MLLVLGVNYFLIFNLYFSLKPSEILSKSNYVLKSEHLEYLQMAITFQVGIIKQLIYTIPIIFISLGLVLRLVSSKKQNQSALQERLDTLTDIVRDKLP